MAVASRLKAFFDAIRLTEAQVDAGRARRHAVVGALNAHYYDITSSTQNSMFVGSWGKETRLRPPRDVDVLFRLPDDAYWRFQGRLGNIQSQILQEVRGILRRSFPYTDIKGDGPVVQFPFSSYNVELIPAFKQSNDQYLVCATDQGGRYKSADYDAERALIDASSSASVGNTRHLIRMMKRWQSYKTVPMKSFWIELLAVEFVDGWVHKGRGFTYYDWMVRDFLVYLQGKQHSTIYAPGTFEPMYIGSDWYNKAKAAGEYASKACDLELYDAYGAGSKWQEIFGTDIPRQA